MTNPLQATGEKIFRAAQVAGFTLELLWRTVASVAYVPRRLPAIFTQMYLCGIQTMPVVILVALFSGMIVSLQIGTTLKDLGMQSQVGEIVAKFMVREWAVVMTAFILAGRVGSAMAAELGAMQVSEEIDALEVMSIDPANYLVLPRVAGLALMTPILTIYGNIVGIIGGGLVAICQIGVTREVYFNRVWEAVYERDVYSALLKALVFGVLISIIGCAQGLSARRGAEDVGRCTRCAVVYAFVMILISTYFISWVFYG